MSEHDEVVEFETIGGRVMRELNRRLATPQLAEDLPGTLLMKVAMDYVKHLEKKNEIEEAKLNSEKLNPLEMIDQPGLPVSLRYEILDEYTDELEAIWREASERLRQVRDELLKEAEDGAEVVPDVQEVVPEE